MTEVTFAQFLQINGPWGFAGACLVMMFWLFVREKKSTETSLAVLGVALDKLADALEKHDARVSGMEARLVAMEMTLRLCEQALQKQPRAAR